MNQTKAPAATHTEKAAPIKGEVVSTDATAKTITVKDASGSNVTLTATGAAVAELSKVKAGDMGDGDEVGKTTRPKSRR